MTSLNDFSALLTLVPEEERDKITNPGKIQRRVYCEIEFLEKIKFLLEKAVNPMQMTETDLQTKALFDILVNFDLYLDVTQNAINKLLSSSYNSLKGVNRVLWCIMQQKQGNSRSVKMKGKEYFVSIESINENSKPEILNALFMTVANNDKCKQITNSYGVAIMQFDTVEQFVKPKRLLNNSWLEQQIEKSERVTDNWGILNNVTCQANSIIVVDGYILRSEKSLRLNVLPILDKLLPKGSLTIPFNITFIVNDRINDDELSINDARVHLYGIIKQLNRDYAIAFNIFNMKGKEHNRWVITNNQYIKCEAGFDLIVEDDKNRRYYSKSTNVHVSCIYSNPHDRKDYESLCKRIIGYQNDRYNWHDNAENRLLS